MKKIWFLLPVLLLALLAFIPAASARTAVPHQKLRPASTSATADQDWSGNAFGGYTQANIMAATSNFNAGYYQYYMVASNSTWVSFAGFEDAISTGLCGTGLHFFVEVEQSGVQKYLHCWSPTSIQLGGDVRFGISWFATGGPGIYLWVDHTLDTTNECSPCSYNPGSHPTYTDLQLDFNENGVVYIANGDVSASAVFFSHNQWISTSDVTNYQASAGTLSSPNPPEMGRIEAPATGGTGGVFEGCGGETVPTNSPVC